MTIKFSIVTVVLNDLRGIRATHLSLLRQRNKNYEWIVKDGGSVDGTKEFLESLAEDFKLISGKDSGIYDAMNLCVQYAKNDFVVFMNAGDIFYDEDVLSNVESSILNGDEEGDILFGGAILRFPRANIDFYRTPRKSATCLWHGLPANHQATYYRRSLLEKCPYDLKYSLCGDYYLDVKFIELGAIEKYLNRPLAIFEVGGESYKRLSQLFIEPYYIQRDVLRSPFYLRIASAIKRLVSTLAFIVLSQPLLNKKADK